MSLNKLKLPFVILTILLLGGCAGAFKRPDPSADFGPPPQNYEQAIKDYFEVILKDPESARHRFGTPQKAYANEGLAYGGDVSWYGWLVDVDVNAKNSFGGYTGGKPYMVFFKGDRVIKHVEGRSHVLVHRL